MLNALLGIPAFSSRSARLTKGTGGLQQLFAAVNRELKQWRRLRKRRRLVKNDSYFNFDFRNYLDLFSRPNGVETYSN